MRRVFWGAVTAAIIGLWLLKAYFVDALVLRLGYHVLVQPGEILNYRVVEVHFIPSTSGREAAVRLLCVKGDRPELRTLVNHYELYLIGGSRHGLHTGAVIPTIRFNKRRVLLATATLYAAFFELVFSALPDLLAVTLLSLALYRCGLAKLKNNNWLGGLAFVTVFVLPLTLVVGELFFLAAVGSGWITDVKTCAIEAAFSAGIACALLPICLIAILNLPPLRIERAETVGFLES